MHMNAHADFATFDLPSLMRFQLVFLGLASQQQMTLTKPNTTCLCLRSVYVSV